SSSESPHNQRVSRPSSALFVFSQRNRKGDSNSLLPPADSASRDCGRLIPPSLSYSVSTTRYFSSPRFSSSVGNCLMKSSTSNVKPGTVFCSHCLYASGQKFSNNS